MATWIRIFGTVLLLFAALLLHVGIYKTWIDFFYWHTGPIATYSVNYNLVEPYRTGLLLLAYGLLFFLWLPALQMNREQ
jgi:hypothetical protein